MGRYTQRPDTGRWPATHPCLQLTLCLAGWFTHLFHRVRRIARDRHALPKMSFPRFTGANPTIWKDKCLDYFRIFNIHTFICEVALTEMLEKSEIINQRGYACASLVKFRKSLSISMHLYSYNNTVTAHITRVGSNVQR